MGVCRTARRGQLEEVPVELMSKGRELADKLKVPLAVLLGGRLPSCANGWATTR